MNEKCKNFHSDRKDSNPGPRDRPNVFAQNRLRMWLRTLFRIANDRSMEKIPMWASRAWPGRGSFSREDWWKGCPGGPKMIIYRDAVAKIVWKNTLRVRGTLKSLTKIDRTISQIPDSPYRLFFDYYKYLFAPNPIHLSTIVGQKLAGEGGG